MIDEVINIQVSTLVTAVLQSEESCVCVTYYTFNHRRQNRDIIMSIYVNSWLLSQQMSVTVCEVITRLAVKISSFHMYIYSNACI